MLKNVTFLQWENDGRVSYRLLGPDGTPIPPFEAFANFLARKSKRNTRRTYCFQLAHFFDYLYEATALLSWDRGPPTRLDLEEVIEAYDDYLVMGGDSGNSIARLVNKSMPSPQNSSKSSALAHSAIRQFLKLSERVRLETL